MHSEVRGKKSDGVRWASIPFFVKGKESEGMIRRQCTSEYKIGPIEKFIKQELLKFRFRQKTPRVPVVEKWFGISIDEVSRLRHSQHKWAVNEYPLCGMPYEYLPKRYSRQLPRLVQQEISRAPSAEKHCIGCPFHSNAEWREIKARPDEWADAVEFDNAMRDCGGMRGQIFLHRSLKPLEDVDLRTAEDKGQGNLWNNKCQGMCAL